MVKCTGEMQPLSSCGVSIADAPLGWEQGLKGRAETSSFTFFFVINSQFVIQDV